MKNQESSNKTSHLTDQILHVLTLEHIKRVDEMLKEVGDYGEVHIIVEHGVLRYVNKVNAHKFTNLQKPLIDHTTIATHTASIATDTQLAANEFSFPHKLNNIEFNLNKSTLSFRMTPEVLISEIIPYIKAISQLQEIVGEVKNLKTSEVYIKSISQNSPVSVSLDGASDVLQIIQNVVTPWRNKHIKELASLLEKEKLLDIECKKAEILEKHALAEKSRSEAKKISAEVDKQRVEINRMKLENEKIQIELHREKIKLALDVLKYISPGLTETEKIAYVVKILQPLDILITSDTTLSLVDRK